MAHFQKPAVGSSSRYVVDGAGALKKVKVPDGETVVVDLWGGGDIVGGHGEILRVDVANPNRHVANVTQKKAPGGDWISSWTVRGNMKGPADLVALDASGRVFATVAIEVTALDASHVWEREQWAPRSVWNTVIASIPRTRWLGILMGPGHEDHSEGRAVDLGLWEWVPEEKDVAEAIVALLWDKMREVGWSYFIWNKQIYINDRPGPIPYTGLSQHKEHIHVSWNRETSQRMLFPQFAVGIADIGSKYPGAKALPTK